MLSRPAMESVSRFICANSGLKKSSLSDGVSYREKCRGNSARGGVDSTAIFDGKLNEDEHVQGNRPEQNVI